MSYEEVNKAVETLRNETAELYQGLKQETLAENKKVSATMGEIKEKLEAINKAVEIAEDAKAAAEKAQATAQAMRSVEPMLNAEANVRRKTLDDLYHKKHTDAEFEAHERHRKLFVSYMLKGDQNMLQADVDFLRAHTKDLTGIADPNGGYVVIPEMDAAITRVIYETSDIRKYAQVKTINTDQYEKLQRVDLPTAVWLDRLAPPGTTTTPTYQKMMIRANNVGAEPMIHQLMLDDAAVDVENEVVMALAETFMLTENTAFVKGDGNGQPNGFLNYPASAPSDYPDYTVATIVANWGKIEQVPAGSTSTIMYDGLVDLQTELKEPYHTNAVWIMNRATRGAVRLLKNGIGDPMWAPGLAGAPSELFGYPVLVAADMPAITSNSLSIAFGDFSMGYTIVDRMGTRLLRDPYTNKPYIKYFTTKRTGGGVDNYEAIKLQKFSVS